LIGSLPGVWADASVTGLGSLGYFFTFALAEFGYFRVKCSSLWDKIGLLEKVTKVAQRIWQLLGHFSQIWATFYNHFNRKAAAQFDKNETESGGNLKLVFFH